MPAAKIFITGASGYIGGSFLSTMLKYPGKYEITALVRSKDQAEILRKLGVTPVLGSLDDVEILAKHAQKSDAVVHTAHADHLASAQALVRGLKAKNSPSAVYLHTSGTGVLTFSGKAIAVPFDDLDMTRIHSIPITSPHKDVDSWIYDNVDGLRAAIIAPSTINGIGSGPIKKTSQQVMNLARGAKGRGQAGWVGPRKDVLWGNVNIHDLAELYRLVLDGLLAGNIQHGREGGWYFGSVQEHTWVEVAKRLAVILQNEGLIKSTDLTQFEDKYVDKYLFGVANKCLWEGDSRCVANRSKSIGWNPTHPNVYETLEQEIKYMIANGEL